MGVVGFRVLIGFMCVCVVALFAVILAVDRPTTPEVTPSPSVTSPIAPPPAGDGGLMGMAPMELNWVLIRMVSNPDLALKGKQKDGVVRILREDKKLVTEMNPLWTEYETWVRKALTAEQKRRIAAWLRARQPLQRPGGGPMHEQLFALLEERSGVAFLSADLDDLVKQARAVPFADPSPVANSLNPEDFAYGLLALEGEPTLRISRQQAVQILPYVKLQNDLYQAHQKEKAAIVALLDERQRRFAAEARGTYPDGVPPAATVDELLAAIEAAR